MKTPCLLAVCFTLVSAAHPSPVSAQEGVHDLVEAAYVSGGVSEESRAKLQDAASQFNVHVIFALKSGEYLSAVEVTVAESSGRVILSAVTDGPWLYARLAPGTYEMRATFSGQSQAQKFTVSAHGARQLVFRWEGER